MKMNFRSLLPAIGLAFLAGLAACSSSSSNNNNNGGLQDVIQLPAGFQPEGVAISGTKLYTGSIPTGRIFKADITTGQGQVLVDPGAGRNSIGMKVDNRGRLFVAGGQTGKAYVYDAETGADLALYTLATGTTFINDVIVTGDAAWFTDSFNAFLYKVPINPDGSLAAPGAVAALPLSGDIHFVAGQFNSNGIAATPDGSVLIIVQSNTGKLFTVNPADGTTKEILLGTDNVINGDGILLQGQTLFVVQNQQNVIAVVSLSADFSTGTVTQRLSSPDFDVPTTVAASDGSLYVVNARFGVANPDTAAYSVVRINKPLDIIQLPAGFQPEGVAISGTKLYTGSIPTGRIFKADITTGQGQVLVDPGAGRNSIGMKVDNRGRLFVAGGRTGKAYVYDAETGADIAIYTLTTGTTFINDVIVTGDAAWFTDSSNAFLYKVPINSDGSLAAPGAVAALPLSGDIQFVPGQTNSNGIAATPDGSVLIIVQSNTGKLFTVSPADGTTKEILLGTDNVINGDGILLQGQTLFVVQNRQNVVAVISLSQDFASGTVTQRVSNAAFDVPTTVAASDGSLYLVNARFGVANPDTAAYSIVRINKP